VHENPERVRQVLNLEKAYRDIDLENVYPLPGRFDSIIDYDRQKSCYGDRPVQVFEKGIRHRLLLLQIFESISYKACIEEGWRELIRTAGVVRLENEPEVYNPLPLHYNQARSIGFGGWNEETMDFGIAIFDEHNDGVMYCGCSRAVSIQS
jgi:hypothetical protein